MVLNSLAKGLISGQYIIDVEFSVLRSERPFKDIPSMIYDRNTNMVSIVDCNKIKSTLVVDSLHELIRQEDEI